MQQNDNARNGVLTPESSAPARLRALLSAGSCRAVPETADGLMGRMVAIAGFEVAFVSLAGSALNRLGTADAGLLTATELVDNASRCIASSGLATVVDAGTGFGNPINVRRTVSELQRAGAAGVMLCDAQEPRAHRHATASISVADMAAKLRAAVDVRAGAPLVLIAAVEGAAQASSLATVAGRAARYREAGADMIHVGMLRDPARAVAIASELAGMPLSCSLAPDSGIDTAELGALGFQLAFFPHCGLMAAVPAIEHTFAELARTGTVGHLRPHIADFRQFTDIAGLPQVQQLEERYGVPDEQRTTL
ncbi:isocitrate lyase/PEP mutase family protein [Caenimonas aquaedulcis]|uniref:Isocitrate lyase/phosphoenolpyruvate mutase family protein n=1 Tax=Caenimonas aquaedulcis TaxID=2793270 RepID=A0A931H0P5_9BURK|nr:isocitrate lyase/phosphoenolpyruvate mutase family protein [Caenimonas aquaedulcis]MBG9386406.1 isocitrate lyase/phosphoenolpyruvate mutase family protein [Caenimonas aquaedulcis]